MGLVDLDNLKLGQGEDFPPSGEFMKLNTQQGQINWLAQALDEVNEAAGGEAYTLPAATAETLGGVKVGANLSVAADGTLSADTGEAYTLPAATAETLGGVKVGVNIIVEADGTLSTLGGNTFGDARFYCTVKLNLAGATGYMCGGDLSALSKWVEGYTVPQDFGGEFAIIPTTATPVTLKTFEYGTTVEDEYTITIECPFSNISLELERPQPFALYIDGGLSAVGEAYKYEYDETTNALKIALMATVTKSYSIASGNIAEVRFYPNVSTYA